MMLGTQFLRAEAQWLEPEEVDDPLEGVEHPRERKPRTRDRFSIRWQMQRAINEREARTIRDFGNGWRFPTSISYQSWTANHAQFEVRRALITREFRRMHPAARAEYFARLRRYVMKARELRLASARAAA
jgi:hypothetical protein